MSESDNQTLSLEELTRRFYEIQEQRDRLRGQVSRLKVALADIATIAQVVIHELDHAADYVVANDPRRP